MNFFSRQPGKVKEKIDHVLFVITNTGSVPEKFIKHTEEQKEFCEIRIEASNKIFLAICCFDKGKIVVLSKGFQNKTQKHAPAAPRSPLT